MNERDIAKIRGFINDRDMSTAVFELLLRNFLQRKMNTDVHILAAQTLAVQFLQEAWVEMERHKIEPKKGINKLPTYV